MKLNNIETRLEIDKHNLKYKEVAEQIGITKYTLSRWLGNPLNEKHKEIIENAINELVS